MKGFDKALPWVAALAVAGITPAAQAMPQGLTIEAAATVAPNRYLWADDASVEPVTIVISIADQRAYVYRGTALIAVSSVSTGMAGKDTPAVTYPILQNAKRTSLTCTMPRQCRSCSG